MDADLKKSFSALTGHGRMLLWQRELLEQWLLNGRLPQAVDLPTGLGKTSVMALWLLALAVRMKEHGAPGLPRRLIYVVDRRAVVDQATAEAEKLRENLANKDALAWMREALGLADGAALPVSTLRGQLADNRAWLADPAAPAIIAGTVDMIGSRLLFSGYGVSEGMRPYHAGLLGVDALVLLDEAHLVPAFQRLLEGVSGVRDASPWHAGALWPEREIVKPLHVVPLSATHLDGGAGEDVYALSTRTAGDDEIVRRRLRARKRLELRPFREGKPEEHLAAAVKTLLETEEGLRPRRVIVYCHQRGVAQKVYADLRKQWGGRRGAEPQADIELFTGARRVFERELAAERLEKLGFIASDETWERNRPAILVATSAAEVGVDLDADDCVCDLVPLERMIQRFGRVNRRGAQEDARIVVLHPDPLPGKGAQAAILEKTLQALERLDGDASPQALRALAPRLVKEASTPPPLHPPLTLPVVESWALTNLKEHAGRPDVGPWLRGWVEEEQPRAEIIWRQHLPWPEVGAPQEKEVNAFFAAARPHLLEVLETEAGHIADMLRARAKKCEGMAKGIILLNRRNEFAGHLTIADLQGMTVKQLQGEIAFKRVVVPADLGGLDKEGLLEKKAVAPVSTLDVTEDEQWQWAVGFRVREKPEGGQDWRVALRLSLTDDEEEGGKALEVEVYRGADERALSGDPAIARQPQGLVKHLEQVREEADGLARRLNLPEELAKPLRLAAMLHDMGKRRRRWQVAMGGNEKAPLAKTTGGGNGRLLGGFRHELASVLDALADDGALRGPEDVFEALADIRAEMAALEDWQRDLMLHLVAAHHGRARPLMPAIDDDLPPSRLEREVRQVALRFAWMQRRFGPWGLAWLETLLRAADQRASRRLDLQGDAPSEPGRIMEAANG